MTVSTEMFYTGYDPYTLEPVYAAHTQDEKLAQREYFFWYKNKPTHGDYRTKTRREESKDEKRGLNRRHK
jgi:hypothetical protein